MYIAHVARARLRDRHQENLKKKLEVLKAQQNMDYMCIDRLYIKCTIHRNMLVFGK